jgi:putative endonuclease
MPRFFYVYVLVSKTDKTIRYTGVTRDLQARVTKHNQGGCVHTSKHRPWHLEIAVAFRSERKAHAFEKGISRAALDANSHVVIFDSRGYAP